MARRSISVVLPGILTAFAPGCFLRFLIGAVVDEDIEEEVNLIITTVVRDGTARCLRGFCILALDLT